MKPLRARYQKIEQIVTDLLKTYDVQKAPVPVLEIARGEGAKILFNEFNNEVSGMLLRTSTDTIIAVEKRQPPVRKRFTIAHELGHLLLHAGQELRVDKNFKVNLRSPESSNAENVEEIEANAFAASLLMPQHFLQHDVENFVLDVEDESDVKSLAKRYDVSSQAMTIRLVNLLDLHRL